MKQLLLIAFLVSLNRGLIEAQERRVPPFQRQIQIRPNRGGAIILNQENLPSRRTPVPTPAPVVPPPPPMPTRVPLSEARLDELVSDLQSGEFRERVKATRVLKNQGGVATVERMSQLLSSVSPEASMRALSVLEAIFLSDDDEANRAAEKVLYQLTLDRFDSLAELAGHILTTNENLRSRRAVSDLLSMGLQIDYSKDFFEIDDRTGELYPAIASIRLTREWSGGKQGVRQIARLDRIGVIYVIHGCPLSADEVEEILHPLMPEVRVEKRGAAQLGIQASIDYSAETRGVKINYVTPGKAAHLGGIRANDLITHIDGKLTPDFPSLVKRLQRYQPGDVIEVIVGRESGPASFRVLDVRLMGW